MPFYRSNFSSSSGGGGGGSSDSSHISITTNGNAPYIAQISINTYVTPPEDVTAISKIEIGNKIMSADYLAVGGYNSAYFNAVVDLTNATSLNSLAYAFENCINFNSVVRFPSRFDCVETVNSYGALDMNYSNMFANCENYNLPTTIRVHDYATDNEYSASVSLGGFFANCFSFNSRVIFDFNKINRNVNDVEYAYLHSVGYYCYDLFYNCRSFNQPLIFPPLMSGFSNHVFNNCNNFNQPIVFDLYGFDPYSINFAYVFNKLPNMSSDIILLNSDHAYNKYCFTHMFNSSRNHMTNIYIENITNIINDQIITGGPNNISGYTVSTSPYNGACNVYTNTTFNITISEDVQHGLNEFNNYYYNFYGEYPVIMNLLNY